MIIYRCLVSSKGDELISDAYKIIPVGGGMWEVDCKKVTVGGEDFVLEGANASAEGEDAEDLEANTQTVLDVVRDFRLQEGPPYDKKGFMGDMKKYFKSLENKMKERGESEDKIKEMKADAPAAIKKIAANIGDYDVFIGEGSEPGEGWPVLVNYREDGITPYATFFKWGLEEYKV